MPGIATGEAGARALKSPAPYAKGR